MIPNFTPSTPAPADSPITNTDFYPDLSVAEMRAMTGLGSRLDDGHIAAALRMSMMDVNQSLAAWRATLSPEVNTLADAPAEHYGGESEKITLYKTGVYYTARGRLLSMVRDLDTTKSGHDRADTLEDTAADHLQIASVALARLQARPPTTVELI